MCYFSPSEYCYAYISEPATAVCLPILRSTLCDLMEFIPTRLLCPWDFLDKNTGATGGSPY